MLIHKCLGQLWGGDDTLNFGLVWLISATFEVYLKTLFGKIFCFSDFLGGQGRDRDGTDIWKDRLFFENIILDIIELGCHH